MGYIWLCGILVLLLFLLAFPVRLGIEFGYSKNAKKQRLTVTINGFKVYKTDFENREAASKAKEEKKKDDYTGFMDKLRRIEALYTQIKDDVVKILKYLTNRCVIPKFVVHLDIGFTDAAQTGMASGAAYALVYGIAGAVYNNLHLKKKNMDIYVQPQFHKACIDFYFNGIIRLRVAHIIKVLIMALGIYNKSKTVLNTKEGGVLV